MRELNLEIFPAYFYYRVAPTGLRAWINIETSRLLLQKQVFSAPPTQDSLQPMALIIDPHVIDIVIAIDQGLMTIGLDGDKLTCFPPLIKIV